MGKSAIEGAKRGNYFWVEPDRLIIIGIDTKDGPEHPLYDVTERHLNLDPALVANIKHYGIINPVKFRKETDDRGNERLVVIAGRRRVLHARQAVKEQRKAGEMELAVPCIPEKDGDGVLMGIMASENEHRRDDDILTKAKKAAKMMRTGGLDEDEVAVAFGVAKNTIKNWLRLLEADPKLHKAIDSGKVSESAAAKLAALPRTEQAPALEEAIEEAAKNGGGKVTQQAARAKANAKSGRTENVGINSRKVLKKLRDEYTGEGDGDEEYAAGVRDALNLVLGDQAVTGKLIKDAKKFAKKFENEASA